MDYIGIKMLDFQYKQLEVEKYSDKYNAYLVIEENMPEHHRLIMKVQEIEYYLSKQDKIKKGKEKSEQREKEEEKRQQEEDFKINNTWGYADNLPPMQKGRILKILNKKINYYHDGEHVANMARKDFIKSMLEKGYYIEHKQNIKYWAKNGELKIKKMNTD